MFCQNCTLLKKRHKTDFLRTNNYTTEKTKFDFLKLVLYSK